MAWVRIGAWVLATLLSTARLHAKDEPEVLDLAKDLQFGPEYNLDSTGTLPGSEQAIEGDLQFTTGKANQTNTTVPRSGQEDDAKQRKKEEDQTSKMDEALVRSYVNGSHTDEHAEAAMSMQEVKEDVLKEQQKLLDRDASVRYKIEQEQLRQQGKPPKPVTKGLHVNSLTQKFAAPVDAELVRDFFCEHD